MRKAIPYQKAITTLDVYNLRVCALMLMKKIKAEGKSLDLFDFKPDIEKQLFTPLRKISDDFLDDAVKSAREVFYGFLNDDQ